MHLFLHKDTKSRHAAFMRGGPHAQEENDAEDRDINVNEELSNFNRTICKKQVQVTKTLPSAVKSKTNLLLQSGGDGSGLWNAAVH